MQTDARVLPLGEAWREIIDAVLARRGAPTTGEVSKLAPRLEELSRAYNGGLVASGAPTRAPLEARLAFSFARDVPKGAGAVRELVRTGALVAPPDRALRVVDLGAGLGAMTWGVARALVADATARRTSAAADGADPPAPLRIDALLVDDDAEVLVAAEAIAREATARLGADAPALTVRSRVQKLAPGMALPEADVVILGQVLSELDVGVEPLARAARHAALIADLLERVVAPDGSLVIIEPALRDRTRHLHAVHDALVAAGRTVFAPCLHAGACPMLTTEGDWCHEDLAVDLPPWVAPLARAAGLRWQGLTFSHLVLRRDGRRLVDEARPPIALTPSAAHVHLRVVSELMRTKGKAEIFACTASGERLRIRRLDRDAARVGPGAAATNAWQALGRGDVVTLHVGPDGVTPLDERGRLAAAAEVDVWPSRK
jgi:ribosomal protein RSM22 (predicted rRNA methylase)